MDHTMWCGGLRSSSNAVNPLSCVEIGLYFFIIILDDVIRKMVSDSEAGIAYTEMRGKLQPKASVM